MYCKKIIYYNDELNDDFATIDNLEKKKIDDKYNYFRHNNILYKFFADTLYFVIAKPLTKIMMLLIYHNFIHGRFKILKAKKTGFFVYANHTNILPDAYTPNHIYHRRNYIITARDTVSIKGVGVIVDALGAIPLPDTIKAAKNFKESINKKLKHKAAITIYPEAHIWPYYTKIRHFKKDSLKYPIISNCPAYAMTTCYKKRLIGKRPRISTYIDGPFYPDLNLSKEDRLNKLYDQIYSSMDKRCKEESNYEYYKYIKKEDGINATSN